jgi:CTP synthase (UTP-ammonia lyase)
MPERAHGITLRIGLLGGTEDPALQPAVGAAIGDAADRMGVTIELVTLADPKALPRGLAGLVLPGGSAMASVPAQCEAALQAADSGLPVFGLCLGMQSMATALMRGTWPDAMLEEIAGPGAHRSFVRLRGAAGPRHRLGEARFVPAPGTRLAELMPKGAAVRLNHRYAMAPDAPLPTEATIHHGPDGIAEAIELTGHPFFIGLQGHPEFGCDPALAVLWDGFLAAACERSR